MNISLVQRLTAVCYDNLRLYLRYTAISVRGQLQFRASFVMMVIGNLVGTGIEFLGICALFHRFGSLHGWHLQEIGLFYGVVNVAFAIAEAAGRGFDMFDKLVISGDFDRILLRPRSTALQVAAGEVQLMRVGRLLQGATVLAWALHSPEVHLAKAGILLVAAAIVGGASTFIGLMVLQATMCFWTVQSLEIMNTVTYGGTETAQYPLTIYKTWFRRFFTVVVPLACANYLPLSMALGKTSNGISPVIAASSPLVGVAFFVVALIAWRSGVHHYHSTGS